jgi:hypothetical protein
MMLPPKVSRSTIAAQSLGSVKVLVQPPDGQALHAESLRIAANSSTLLLGPTRPPRPLVGQRAGILPPRTGWGQNSLFPDRPADGWGHARLLSDLVKVLRVALKQSR